MINQDIFIDKSARVDTTSIGKGTRIWGISRVLENAIIGENCNICDFVFIENDVIIGDNVTVKCGVYIWDGIRIENNVFIGPNVTFTNDLYPRSKAHLVNHPKTVICFGASIGANSVLVAGNTIGKFSMIGAGSVVTKDVSPHEIVYGNPAIHRGYICSCARKLLLNQEGRYECECGNKFQKISGLLCQI